MGLPLEIGNSGPPEYALLLLRPPNYPPPKIVPSVPQLQGEPRARVNQKIISSLANEAQSGTVCGPYR
jgi:hypothetical protein